jgi:hypothetical protein
MEVQVTLFAIYYHYKIFWPLASKWRGKGIASTRIAAHDAD